MNKIVEYGLFCGEPENDGALCDLVNSYIKKGWVPIGGACSSKSYAHPNYEVMVQAMVRYETEDQETVRTFVENLV